MAGFAGALRKLSEAWKRTVKVKYFAAIIKSTTGSKQRQEIYLKALQAHCNKLEIHYGWILSKTKRC